MTSNLAKNLKQPALDFLSYVNASPTRMSRALPLIPHRQNRANHSNSFPCGAIVQGTASEGGIPGDQGAIHPPC